jgi:hypothetical protein
MVTPIDIITACIALAALVVSIISFYKSNKISKQTIKQATFEKKSIVSNLLTVYARDPLRCHFDESFYKKLTDSVQIVYTHFKGDLKKEILSIYEMIQNNKGKGDVTKEDIESIVNSVTYVLILVTADMIVID